MNKQIQLRKGKEKFLESRHPWIFSGALYNPPKSLKDGEIVSIISPLDESVICTGYYNHGSIAVRILEWEDVVIDEAYWKVKCQNAYRLKQSLLQLDDGTTNAYRLISGEGDGVPGLIVDVYASHIVIQGHNPGIITHIPTLVSALGKVEGLQNHTISTSHKGADKPKEDKMVEILENDLKLLCNVTDGQKTGFFLDQKDNRQLLRRLSKGKSVVNLFSYTGGFSISALAGGATQVLSVDISQPAIDLCEQNVALNQETTGNHEGICADVMQWLKDCPQDTYDILVVDPPAFAKSLKKKHNAVQAYKRLNAQAISTVKSGGFILTFSCSQVVDRELFIHTIRSAAMITKRKVKVLKYLCQSADHAVDLYHREGQYLKGLLLSVY